MEFFAGMEHHQLIHEIKEVDAAFALVVASMDLAGGDVQGRKKRRGAMALVLMGEAGERTPVGHAQPALRPFEGLDAWLFVNREHHRIVRRTQVETNDIGRFLRKLRIG